MSVERKGFSLALCENHRGRLLRITEAHGERINSIIIPASSGLEEFARTLAEIAKAAEELPPVTELVPIGDGNGS